MQSERPRHRSCARFVMIALLNLALATTLLASPGGEKSEEETKAERLRKATHEYNEGAKLLAKAQDYEKTSDSLFAYNYRATNSAKAKREYEKAVKKYDNAIKLNPEFPEAHSDRGYCLRKLGLLEESLKSYNTALKLAPNYGPALEYRGEAFLALGQPDKAQDALEKLNHLAAKDSPQKKSYATYAETLKRAIGKYRLEHFTESDSL